MLSAAEVVDVRRYAGYSAAGAAAADDPVALALAGLTPEGEAVLRASFLPGLAGSEAGMTGAVTSLDTAKAAVWERNANELVERSLLYRIQRIALCRFLGIDPGPGIYDPLPVVPAPEPGGGSLALPPAILVV